LQQPLVAVVVRVQQRLETVRQDRRAAAVRVEMAQALLAVAAQAVKVLQVELA
jgi:hypothetical protein